MTAEIIGRLIRQVLLVLGGLGIGRGLLDERTAEELGGALAVLIAFVWSWVRWLKAKRAASSQ